MCVTDRHDMTLAVKVVLNPNTTNQQSNPFPNDKDSSKLKESEDYNFKFDEIGRKFSKRVEDIVRKGGITCYEQFLLFPYCL